MEIKEMKMEIVDKLTLSKSIGRRLGLTISDVMKIIDIFEDEIIDAIKNNKKVQLNGFLIFTPKDIEGRTITSPLDNKEYVVDPKRTVDVRVGKYFKESIKESYKPVEVKEDVDNKEPRRTRKSKK